MKRTPLPNTEIKQFAFRDKQSGAWFYWFQYNWSVYRSSFGFDSKEEAEESMKEHLKRVQWEYYCDCNIAHDMACANTRDHFEEWLAEQEATNWQDAI